MLLQILDFRKILFKLLDVSNKDMEVMPYIILSLHYTYFNEDYDRNRIIFILKQKLEQIVQAVTSYQDSFRGDFESKESLKFSKSRNSIKLDVEEDKTSKFRPKVIQPPQSIEIPETNEQVIFEKPSAPKGQSKKKNLFVLADDENENKTEHQQFEKPYFSKPKKKENFEFPVDRPTTRGIEIPEGNFISKEPAAPKGQKPKFLFPGDNGLKNEKKENPDSKKFQFDDFQDFEEEVKLEVSEDQSTQLQQESENLELKEKAIDEIPKPKLKPKRPLQINVEDINQLYTFGGEGGDKVDK